MFKDVEEQYIQLVANYGDWKAVKKLKIEAATDSRTVLQFLASLGISLDNKIEQNLRKTVALEKLDAVLAELPKGKSEAELAEMLSAVSGGKVNKSINEITKEIGVSGKELAELQEFCKVYALKKALKESGLFVDYSAVHLQIPGMKKSFVKKAP
ncbi:MAG: DUF2666 family protein [Candidatus Diapherotrites archaeon]